MILELKASMNKGRDLKSRLDCSYSLNKTTSENTSTLSDSWIRGFTDGDGGFLFHISEVKRKFKSGFSIIIQWKVSLHYTQNSYDRPLLDNIKRFFCGYITPKQDSTLNYD